jgi:flagellar biosynthetic protein FliR
VDLDVLSSFLLRVDLFLLLFLRVLGLFTTAPIWSNRVVPVQLRVALALATAAAVLPLFGPPLIPTTLAGLAPMALQELLVGMLIGFIASLALSAIQFAGQLLDINMGLAMVNVLDPMTNTQVPIMGNFLHLVAMLIFLSINGHHMLLRALMDSYALVPVGTAALSDALSRSLIEIAANLFVVGLKVAAPVLAALFLTTVALGLLNRAVPQMNVFVIGLPVQLAVGIFMLMVALPLYLSFLQVIFRGMSADILTALRLLGG